MAFDLGDTVTLTYSAIDPATQVPVTPSAVVLRITQPDSTVVTPSFTQPSGFNGPIVGSYVCYFVPAQSGRYGVEWNSTGPATDYTDAFDVNDAEGVRYMVSLAAMKKQLNIPATNTGSDEEILEYIASATFAVEKVRSEKMVTTTIVAEEHEVTGGRCSLNWSPVQSVTDVRTIDQFVIWDPARLHVDKASGVLSTTFLSGLFELWGRIQVTYVAGYTSIPPAYQLAAKIIVQHLWMTKRGAGNTPQPGGFELDAVSVPGIAFAVPYRALELLGNGNPGFA